MTSDPIQSIPGNLANWALIRNAGDTTIQFLKLDYPKETNVDPFSLERAFVLGNSEGESSVFEITDQQEYSPNSAVRSESDNIALNGSLDWRLPFKELVGSALQAIENGEFEKVVPSAIWEIESQVPPEEAFNELLAQNPNATVFLIHSESFGIWLGASPEVLFTKTGDRMYSMALAGTRKSGVSEWGQKERKEQSIVTEHIEGILQKLGFEDIERTETSTLTTGEIEHICTGIHARSAEAGSWNELLNQLHPTAALMGYPREHALRFVNEQEVHERELFTGFFGTIEGGNAAFTVMIRCAKYLRGRYRLFAGAGVNAASDPEKEAEEILQKFNVMRSAICP